MSIKNRTKFIKQNTTKTGKPYYSLTRYPEIPLNINDIYITTVSGDRLDLLANQFYNDIRLWWIIASANPNIIRRDSFALAPNIELRIPSNEQDIIDNYEDLNK
jgi:hypothetical protein